MAHSSSGAPVVPVRLHAQAASTAPTATAIRPRHIPKTSYQKGLGLPTRTTGRYRTRMSRRRTPPERREPLPVAFPKSAIDDPDAPARLARLLASPTYLRAEEDAQFLARDELRGARLALEYEKAELTLREHEVASTIVLFVSTRLVEPAAAQRALADCRAAAA